VKSYGWQQAGTVGFIASNPIVWLFCDCCFVLLSENEYDDDDDDWPYILLCNDIVTTMQCIALCKSVTYQFPSG